MATIRGVAAWVATSVFLSLVHMRPQSGSGFFLVACALVLFFSYCAHSADDELQEKINGAIERGVEGLKFVVQDGTSGVTGADQLGSNALIGWTLLENNVAATDPLIEKLAENIRKGTIETTRIYGLTLAIIFLDRLGHPHDTLLIQFLAVRLLEGQMRTGGWGYDCNDSRQVSPAEIDFLKAFLKLPRKRSDPTVAAPEFLRARMVFVNSVPFNAMPNNFGTDNSNTQFAALALWVARRHGVATDRALRLTELRFRSSQPWDGKWSYTAESQNDGKSLGMSCAGLIAIALGRATTPGVDLTKSLGQDPTVIRGLEGVRQFLKEGLPESPSNHDDNTGRVFYALWSLERMGVIYNLKTIGTYDWYDIGARFLVAHQQPGGHWRGAYANYSADTCFALLFLKRANPARDVTSKFKGQLLVPLEKKQSSRAPKGSGARVELRKQPQFQERLFDKQQSKRSPELNLLHNHRLFFN